MFYYNAKSLIFEIIGCDMRGEKEIQKDKHLRRSTELFLLSNVNLDCCGLNRTEQVTRDPHFNKL